MPPRLSALDASFLYLEEASTPMHVGAVSIFKRPKAGFDYDRLVELIEQRIALVPRYRQKVRHVPGNLARPVWVDDPEFDVAYHVRRSALPKPGSDEQLTELVARLMSRPLDHARPLWEMYLVEGLARGRTAVLTKTHQAMVDGISAIDIGQVILDVSPEPRVATEELWMPRNEPTDVELICEAVAEAIARPGEVVDNVRAAAGDAVARSIIDRLADELATMAAALARRAHLVRRGPEVVLAGSVFRTGDAGFHERLQDRITAAIPAARIVRLSAPPVVGAALIGLDRLAGGAADPAVEARARAAFDDWNATPVVVTSS